MIYLKNLNTQASVNYQSSAEGEVHQGRGGVNNELNKKILFFSFTTIGRHKSAVYYTKENKDTPDKIKSATKKKKKT